MAYYYNHRFIVKCIPGQEQGYTRFKNILEKFCEEYTSSQLDSILNIAEDDDAYVRGGDEFARNEHRYNPKIDDVLCEFYLWTRYAPEYWAIDVASDLAYECHVEVFKIFGEEDRPEDGAGYCHAVWHEDADEEDGIVENEYVVFDQHGINNGEYYFLKVTDAEDMGGECLLDHDGNDYQDLNKLLRALAWKKNIKIESMGIAYKDCSDIEMMLGKIHNRLLSNLDSLPIQ